MARRSARPLIGKTHEVGHEVIDTDHQALAECWKLAVSCEPIQLPFYAARLKKLMRSNFDREAELMKRAGGELCACHRQQHGILLDLCDRANALSSRNWRKAQSLLRYQLPKLVREHINCMDQIAALFINANSTARGSAPSTHHSCFT